MKYEIKLPNGYLPTQAMYRFNKGELLPDEFKPIVIWLINDKLTNGKKALIANASNGKLSNLDAVGIDQTNLSLLLEMSEEILKEIKVLYERCDWNVELEILKDGRQRIEFCFRLKKFPRELK